MKKIRLILIAFIAIFVFGCGENEQNTDQLEAQEIQLNDESHEHNGKLVLNDGKKWKMSPSLLAAAEEMSNTVNLFAKAGSNNYPGLVLRLDKGINKLINECELPDGAAHENLHEWLHPYMGLVKELGEVKTEDDGKIIFEKIQLSFKTFEQYFE